MPTYQLVAYNWNDWMGKEIKRVTNSTVSHVTIRINPYCGYSRELYVTPQSRSDAWVLSKAVSKLNGPELWSSRHIKLYHHQAEWVKGQARDWERRQPGSVTKCYLYHYVGRHLGLPSPECCTNLCHSVLNYLGVPVKERFYPNQLVSEFLRETC